MAVQTRTNVVSLRKITNWGYRSGVHLSYWRHHGVIVSIVLELVDFELALSFDLRDYSAGSGRKRCKYINET
jgi:hypothetical protein